MGKTKRNIGMAAAVLLVVAIVFYLFSNDAGRIRKQFDALAGAVSKEAGETTAVMAIKNRQLGELFAKECTMDFPEREFSGTYTATELARLVTQARMPCEHLEITFHNLRIEISGDAADVFGKAQASGKHRGGEAIKETRELECRLIKTDGDWLFSQLTVMILEK